MLIRSFIVQIIMMSVSVNMVLKAEHRQDFGKIKAGLMKQILNEIDPFRGILGTDQVENQKVMKDKLIDGKKPYCLEVNQ